MMLVPMQRRRWNFRIRSTCRASEKRKFRENIATEKKWKERAHRLLPSVGSQEKNDEERGSGSGVKVKVPFFYSFAITLWCVFTSFYLIPNIILKQNVLQIKVLIKIIRKIAKIAFVLKQKFLVLQLCYSTMVCFHEFYLIQNIILKQNVL